MSGSGTCWACLARVGVASRGEKMWDVSCNPLRIAKIDATSNDVDGVDIEGFPTIKFWRADNKDLNHAPSACNAGLC